MQEKNNTNGLVAKGLEKGDVKFIAEMVGCTRQYASAILSCDAKYKQTGQKAIHIWRAYDYLLAEKNRIKKEFDSQSRKEAVDMVEDLKKSAQDRLRAFENNQL